MPFIPAFNTIRVTVLGKSYGQDNINTFHFQCPTTPDLSQLEDLAEVFDAAWQAEILPNMSVVYEYGGVHCVDISVEDGEFFDLIVTPAATGGATGEATPNNVAYGVTWQTSRSGRSFRGRSFLGPLSLQAVAGNVLDTGVSAAFTSDWQDFQTALSSAGYIMCVVSYQENLEPRTLAAVTPIEALRVNEQVRTMRRRLPGAGS